MGGLDMKLLKELYSANRSRRIQALEIWGRKDSHGIPQQECEAGIILLMCCYPTEPRQTKNN